MDNFCRTHFSQDPCMFCSLERRQAKERAPDLPVYKCEDHLTQYSPCWKCLEDEALTTDVCYCFTIRLQRALEIKADPFWSDSQKALIQALNDKSTYCIPCTEAAGYDPDHFNETFEREYEEWVDEMNKRGRENG